MHKERPFYGSLCAFMTQGPCMPIVLEGENAIARLRELMGATDPAKAGPGTIRKDFASSIEANAVHGSDSPESAAFEIPYFFGGARDLPAGRPGGRVHFPARPRPAGSASLAGVARHRARLRRALPPARSRSSPASGDPSLLILPLPFLGALWMIQGLAPTGYTLEEGGLRLERRWARAADPLRAASPAATARRAPIGGLLAAGVNGLFGSHGPRWNPRTGWHYLAITNTDDLVFLQTRGGPVVLSPSRPDEFVTALHAELPTGPASWPTRSS